MLSEQNDCCYHCGLPLAEAEYSFRIEQVEHRVCCLGCQAVAQAIVANGLADYYQRRDALPESPREALPAVLQELDLFDLPEIQKDFVHSVGGEEGSFAREAALILEGVTCAACIWLNEAHLARQPGVMAVQINYTTYRAQIRWDERRIKLSQILAAIVAIGYRAHPYDPARSEQLAQQERRVALWRLFVAGFGMMQVMMYALPVYFATAGEMTADIEQLMRWASLILTLPVMLYSAAPFFRNAWRDLGLRRVGMDVPVALGIGSAFLASCWATLQAAGEVYFDSVTMFIFFLLAGRYFEMMARQRAARGVETLARALPAFASRLRAFPALDCDSVLAATLMVGDIVLVRPGEVVPADGCVIQGESAVDESLLTGESLPISKCVGDTLTGGSTNVHSPLVLRVSKVGAATRLAAIQRLVERAALEKPRLVALADRIALRFVAALLILALLTALVWQVIDPQRALWVFVAVLVVSCPCALSLATPAALSVATGRFSRLGILITRGHAIETLARANHFVFDKTGTLTEGRMQLVDLWKPPDLTRETVLRLAAALEQGSEHPVARAVLAAAEEAENEWRKDFQIEGLRSVTGQGVEATVNGETFRIGRPDFVLGAGALPDEALAWQKTAGAASVVALGNAQRCLALFCLQDRLRPQAAAALLALQQQNIRISILSGDTLAAVAAVAAQLGIKEALGGQSPEDKHAYIQQLQAQGDVVAMLGDGVNDAPVLAQAQVSIAMGGGADLARQQADIVLLAGHLLPLAEGVQLARRTLRIVRQNLVWSFAYNFLAIPLAMFGIVTPWMAGIGMSSSSFLVVLNALRLQKNALGSWRPMAQEAR